VPPEGTLSPDIQAAVDLAERSDVAVVVAGLWEGESRDRGELDLPTDQDELIDGIVQLYHGGEEQGRALADALFGDVNPSGKLPISYPRFDSQPMALGINNPLLTAEDLDVPFSEGVFVGYRG
jgi:beta-glucosidase